jgi:glycosyltransferase involved in cell wall biosynthesis
VEPVDVCLVIRSLGRGGAERQLTVLAEGLKRGGLQVLAVTFYAEGDLEEELSAAKVPLVSLHKRGRWDLLRFFCRLVRVLRSARPQVIYSFLSEPNLICLAARPFLRGARLVWGMGGSKRDVRAYEWVARLSRKAQSPLSRFVDVIIFNSEAGRRYWAAQGFPPSKLVVVPNGIDSESFHPDREKGVHLRRAWGIRPEECVFGLVGNFEPVKGHALFLDAAALVASANLNACFVCIGAGPGQKHIEALRRRADRLGIAHRVIFAGKCADMRSAYNALDVLVSASESEGFANVIGEAMACGVPCVVTDVGDSAAIVGDAGVVVPTRTASALARAMGSLAVETKRRADLGERSRRRIVERYPPDLLVSRTLAALYQTHGFASDSSPKNRHRLWTSR